MKTFFEVTFKLLEENDQGIIKQVSKKCVVEAVGFTDAETQVTEEFASANNSFTVWSITRKDYKEFLGDFEAEVFVNFVIEFIVVSDMGKEKWIPESYLIGAGTVDECEDLGRRELLSQDAVTTRLLNLKHCKNLDYVMLIEEEEVPDDELPDGWDWELEDDL